MRTNRPNPFRLNHANPWLRRGNTLVLVAGILVLLVIVATAYLSRTGAGRVAAVAQQDTQVRDDVGNLIADLISREIADALFVRESPFADGTPLNTADDVLSANLARRPIRPDAVRYGRDFQAGRRHNYAPYHVVPFTNWPDVSFLDDPFTGNTITLNGTQWPGGAGNPGGGGNSAFLTAEYNPRGNPGDADARWLADLEPMRWDSNNDGVPDRFSHWRHLTNLARPGNGWRIIRDAADVFDNDTAPPNITAGGLVTNLDLPHEQWLPIRPATVTTNFPDANASGVYLNWLLWFGVNPAFPNDPTDDLSIFASVYTTPGSIPPNFVRLKDIDGDGFPLEVGERPQDEFSFGSWRNVVSRILADADGDGYTDAFWHLAPTPADRGIRHIVAVRIVDNGGLLNANAATRFARGDYINNNYSGLKRRTKGQTPADLLLTGDREQDDYQEWGNNLVADSVGFFDNALNWEPDAIDNSWADWLTLLPSPYPTGYGPFGPEAFVRWRKERWDDPNATPADNKQRDFLSQIGFDLNDNQAQGELSLELDRLLYWNSSGRRPLSPINGFTPFGLSDELELRMFHGQNHAWLNTRFERAVNTTVAYNQNNTGFSFLRSTEQREETTEYVDQLRNRELLGDNRRKLTLYNNTRNDTRPPWLWRWQPGTDIDQDGNFPPVDLNDVIRFRLGSRKIDLRDPFFGLVQSPAERAELELMYPDIPGEPPLTLAERAARFVRDSIAAMMFERNTFTNSIQASYLGTKTDPEVTPPPGGNVVPLVQRIAAGLTSNILDHRRGIDLVNDTAPNGRVADFLARGVPFTETANPGNPDDAGNLRFLPVEPQPFFTEALVLHVHLAPDDVQEIYQGEDGALITPGTRFPRNDVGLCDDFNTTIFVAQIANPFDVPVDLWKFALKVYGQDINLADPQVVSSAQRFLLPNQVITLYALDPQALGEPQFGDKWRQRLGLDGNNNFVNVVDITNTASLLIDRSTYDTFAEASSREGFIELYRIDGAPGQQQGADPLLVDRVENPNDTDDYGKFGRAARDRLRNFFADCNAPGTPGEIWPGARLEIFVEGAFTHAVQWAHFTRAWATDVDGDGFFDDSESNPRYVFSQFHSDVSNFDKINMNLPLAGNQQTPNQQTVLDWVPSFCPRFNTREKRYAGLLDSNAPACSNGEGSLGTNDTKIRLDFPMQMGRKNGDFDQVGELLNLWLLGHEVKRINLNQYEVRRTFAENMVEVGPNFDLVLERSRPGIPSVLTDDTPAASRARVRVNRLDPKRSESIISGWYGQLGAGAATPDDDPMVPNLPAAVRILDAFVCDGRGVGPNVDLNGDGLINETDELLRRFHNAQAFTGAGTPGLININTALPEVLRALPHWYRLAHQTIRDSTGQFLADTGAPPRRLVPPRVLLPEAVVQYRDRLNGLDGTVPEVLDLGPTTATIPPLALPEGVALVGAPTYSIRGLGLDGTGDGELNDNGDTLIDRSLPRGERGFASIGEVLLLGRPGSDLYDNAQNPQRILESGRGWQADFAGLAPFRSDNFVLSDQSVGNNPGDDGNPTLPVVPGVLRDSANALVGGAYVSTDVTERREVPGDFTSATIDDGVGGDAEEANLLFAGVSNLITTRSDTFTVYFKIRSFRQSPNGVWDATNPDAIVDERRYVMLVDRSEVNAPGDRPKILYLEKLPR